LEEVVVHSGNYFNYSASRGRSSAVNGGAIALDDKKLLPLRLSADRTPLARSRTGSRSAAA